MRCRSLTSHWLFSKLGALGTREGPHMELNMQLAVSSSVLLPASPPLDVSLWFAVCSEAFGPASSCICSGHLALGPVSRSTKLLALQVISKQHLTSGSVF